MRSDTHSGGRVSVGDCDGIREGARVYQGENRTFFVVIMHTPLCADSKHGYTTIESDLT